MNKFGIITVFIFSVFVISCKAQKQNKKHESNIDISLRLIFNENQEILDDNHKNILNDLGEWIAKHNSKVYEYYVEVSLSDGESDDECITFKRVSLVLNYFQENFKIEGPTFHFKFSKPHKSDASMNFVIVQ